MLRFTDTVASESRARIDASAQTATVNPLDTTVEATDLTPFLDEILRRLSSLPADMHTEIRQELRTHLESLVIAHEELGLNRADALIAAIGQFGDPATIARRFRHSYESTLPNATPWAAMRSALLVFGVGMMCYAAIPLPETGNGLFRAHDEATSRLLSAMMLGVFPLVAGGWIGRQTPRRAALGVLYGIAALATLTLPFLLSRVYYFDFARTGDATASTDALDRTLNLLWCLVYWTPLGCLAAAATSRIKWAKPSEGIEALPTFVVRGMGLALLGTMANYAINFGYDFWFLQRQSVSHQVLSPFFSLFLTPVILLLKWVAPVWLGWKIGRSWPLLERWTRKPLTYLLGGALAVLAGNAAIHIAQMGIPHQPIWLTVGPQVMPIVVSLISGYFTSNLPTIGIAALIAANKVRGGNPLLTRLGALAALVYCVLLELYMWAFGKFVASYHGQIHLPFYMLLFPYFLPVVFAAMLWANRRRLPRWSRLVADGEESHASL